MHERKKIFYLIERLARAGTEMHLVRLLESLDRELFEPVLCCLNGAMTDLSLAPAGVRLHLLDGGWNLTDPRELWKIWRGAGRVLREERPDVLHTYLFVSNVIGAFAGRRLGVPAIVSTRGRMGIEWQAGALHRMVQRAADRRVDRILCKTQAMANEIGRVEGTIGNRVVVVPNGVDTERFAPDPRGRAEARRDLVADGVAGDGPLVVSVGNLKPIKGQQTLVEALALSPLRDSGLHVAFVGTGDCNDALKARIASLGLQDHCKLVGSIEDVRPWLAAADIFVASSLSEGMPNSVLEAMAVGVPLVLSDIPGHRETAGNEAWFFKPDTPEHLAAALNEALGDVARRAAHAAEALERVQREYSLKSMVRHIERIYEEVLRERCALR